MEEEIIIQKNGISLSSLLGIVFIVLKLLKIITWSWWWVLAPFWIPFGVAIILIIFYLILILIE